MWIQIQKVKQLKPKVRLLRQITWLKMYILFIVPGWSLFMSLRNLAWKTSQSALRVSHNAKILSQHGLKWAVGPPVSNAVRLRQLFESLGATYIKLGQFVASAPSFFPEDYVKAFQNCLDKTPPIPFETIETVIQHELGVHWKMRFEWIDPIPLASASIAQVHAGRTLAGEDVVLKVQKPGVEHILRTDLHMLETAAIIAEKIAPQIRMASLADICQEIKDGMLAECDFLLEMNNLTEFRSFIKAQGLSQVTAPKPYPQLSTRKLLTMERLYGVAFTNLEEIAHLTPDPQATLIHAMNAWFATLLQGHSFHADVHAGNLLVLRDGRVGFIDFGIVGHVSSTTWEAVQSLVESMMEQDCMGIARAIFKIGMTKATIDINDFARDIESIFTTGPANSGSAKSTSMVDNRLLELTSISKNYGIHFPREFALLMKQLLYFDRYVQLIGPESTSFDQSFYQDQRLSFF